MWSLAQFEQRCREAETRGPDVTVPVAELRALLERVAALSKERDALRVLAGPPYDQG